MTFSAMHVDVNTNKIGWWNAGGPPFFLVDPDTNTARTVSGTSSPWVRAQWISVIKKDVRPGERIVAFTDGLYGFTTKTGNRFGIKKLQQTIIDNNTNEKSCQRLRMSWDPNPSKTICRSLSCSISSFERKSQICDDSSRRDFLGLGIDVNCLD